MIIKLYAQIRIYKFNHTLLRIIVLSFIGLISCNKEKKYSHELICDPEVEFVVHLDSETPADTQMMQFFEEKGFENQDIKTAMLNVETQKINLHDSKGQKIREVSIKEIGDSIPNISGFTFINSDSLLLFSYKSKDLLLVSLNQHFKPKLLVNLDSLDYRNFKKISVEVSSKIPMIYYNGMIYLTGRAMLNNVVSKPQAKQVMTGIIHNIKSGKTDYISSFVNAWEERYWHLEQYFCNHILSSSNENLIYSLAMKDSVVVVNTRTHQESRFLVKTDEFGDEESMIPKEITDPSTIGTYDDLVSYLEKPRYGELIYDKYRNVYYRFIVRGYKEQEMNIIICDSNLKKLGESAIPKSYLASSGLFIDRRGVFLRKSTSNKNDSEIIFTKFNLIKKT